MNIGIIYIPTNSTAAKSLISIALKSLQEPKAAHKIDQGVINTKWKQDGIYPVKDSQGYRLCNISDVIVGILPIYRFCNFYTFQTTGACKDPYALHATWLRAQRNSYKTMRFRELGEWYDEWSWYRPERILTYDNPLLSKLDTHAFATMTDNIPSYHMEAMKIQLQVLSKAIYLSSLLNRTLVLPRIQCFCAQGFWAGHIDETCNIRGSKQQLPYICPSDHFLDVEALGTFVKYREHTFLNNPRTPRRYTEDFIEVGSDRITDIVKHYPQKRLHLSANLAEMHIEHSLELSPVFGSWCCTENERHKKRGGLVKYEWT